MARRNPHPLFATGCSIIGALALFVLFCSLPFFTVPIGSRGRPMAYIAYFLGLSALGLICGAINGVSLMILRRPLSGIGLMAFGFLPFAVGYLVILYATHVRHYQFSE